MLLKAMPGGDVGAHSDLFVPSQWLSETIPRKTPYFPQIGDVLMYFKSGHQKYIELVELRNSYKVNIGLYDTLRHFRGDFLIIGQDKDLLEEYTYDLSKTSNLPWT